MVRKKETLLVATKLHSELPQVTAKDPVPAGFPGFLAKHMLPWAPSTIPATQGQKAAF